VADQGPNSVLAALLAEAGWTPRQLAGAINTMFGAGVVNPTTGYGWLNRGAVPRRHLAYRAAAALSLCLGRTVTASQIWPSIPERESVLPASQGLNGPWDRSNAVGTLADWLTGTDPNRRQFAAVSGAALMGAVWAWLEPHGSLPQGPPPNSAAGGSALADQIESSIPALQRLDDAHGGAAHLPYVEAQLRAVILVVRDRRHPETVVRRLLAACATLGQLCGWMALDAGQPGTAQRHWFTALRAAREVGNRPLAAHILADLAFQAASTPMKGSSGRHNADPRGEHARDAVVLGEAALEIAARSPATVRASVASRLAFAYAAAGRRSEFQAAANRAHDALEARQDAREPDWMYFLTSSHLDCQAGYAHVAMGRRQLALGDRAGRSDLTDGIALLRTGAFAVPAGDPSQRRALYEGAWLALGHAGLGDYTEALALAETAAARLGEVDSPRSTDLLGDLVLDLRPRHNRAEVRERLPRIERVLGRTTR
jgi:hypothetical protein